MGNILAGVLPGCRGPGPLSSQALREDQLEELHMLSGFSFEEIAKVYAVLQTHTAHDEYITRAEFLAFRGMNTNPLRHRLCMCFGFPGAAGVDHDAEADADTVLDADQGGGEREPSSTSTSTAKKGGETSSKGGGEDDDHAVPIDDAERGAATKESKEETADDPTDRVHIYDFMTKLAVFNKPGNKEEKLRTLFKLQDFDDDGMLSRDDLLRYLQLTTGRKTAGTPDEDIATIAAHILEEGSSRADHKYLTFSDFARIVAPTDFEARMRIPLG